MSLRKEIDFYCVNGLPILRETSDFYRHLSLAGAIEYGSCAVLPRGQISPHQRRIGVKCLRESARKMRTYASDIRRALSFADIFAVTEWVRSDTKGLGVLWSYDTSLRIAFQRGQHCYPQLVYLNGRSDIAAKLVFGKQWRLTKALKPSSFPKSLQIFEPFEISYFLETATIKRKLPGGSGWLKYADL